MKVQGIVKIKLAKYLEPLLHVPSPDKYDRWFSLILDPHYVNGLIDVRSLNEIYYVDTRSIFL